MAQLVAAVNAASPSRRASSLATPPPPTLSPPSRRRLPTMLPPPDTPFSLATPARRTQWTLGSGRSPSAAHRQPAAPDHAVVRRRPPPCRPPRRHAVRLAVDHAAARRQCHRDAVPVTDSPRARCPTPRRPSSPPWIPHARRARLWPRRRDYRRSRRPARDSCIPHASAAKGEGRWRELVRRQGEGRRRARQSAFFKRRKRPQIRTGCTKQIHLLELEPYHGNGQE
ncbi:hypothetical protein PVAP13_5NG332100 [Panicum virgatum]|uniref:Uncharacterized protein n=1 Tax=Panicum virgatum TaxID=38727 RepID=A0A8T0RU98_PANVG|nr:hypothetical protein PVAP13_5NG332100 [Panicum virgatum]